MAKINLKNLLSINAGLIIIVPSTVGILADINTPVIESSISNQKIVAAINQVKTYQIMIFIKTGITVESLKAEMTPDFIQAQLTGEIKTAFNRYAFNFKDFIYNNRDLENSDLEGFGTIYAEIKYDYGSFKNQTTNFIINKTLSPENINQEIQNHEYNKSIIASDKNSVPKFLEQEFNGKLIQKQLEDNASQAIVPALFSVNEIIANGKPLADNDLWIAQTITTIVDYNYDDFGGQIKLIIDITQG